MIKCPECGNSDLKLIDQSDRTHMKYCRAFDCNHKWLKVEDIVSGGINEQKTQKYIQNCMLRIKEMKRQINAMEENLERLNHGPVI